MSDAVASYLAAIGRRGGKVSRRRLSTEEARSMVQVREGRRAFRRFYTMCFWSSPDDYVVTRADLPWVAKQLMKPGGREGWLLGSRLCR